jgi:serine/threonine protein kinase
LLSIQGNKKQAKSMDHIRDDNTGSNSIKSGTESLLDALHSPHVVSNLNIQKSSSDSRQRQNSTSSETVCSASESNCNPKIDSKIGDDDDDDDDDDQSDVNANVNANDTGSSRTRTQSSGSVHDVPGPGEESNSPNNNNANVTSTFVAKEQERKQLILYLLAQVCALHDSTPKTFIVHVLSLYESGILDDESITLLMNHGLVPSAPSSPSSTNQNSPNCPLSQINGDGGDYVIDNAFGDLGIETKRDQIEYESTSTECETIMIDDEEQNLQVEYTTRTRTQVQVEEEVKEIHHEVTNAIIPKEKPIPATSIPSTSVPSLSHQIVQQQTQTQIVHQVGPDTAQVQNRSRKVYAIRKLLEQHETINNWKTYDTTAASSWTVEHHPLSFSRYNRDFLQKELLASGSFGQVFHALNKLDGCDYAVKRVAFSAKGYDTKQVEVVVREVQCLAKMGHENVVRYYTSWLEPTWTPGAEFDADQEHEHGDDGESESGDGISRPARARHNQLLLGGPHHEVDESASSFQNSNDDGQDDNVDGWDQLASHQSDGFDPSASISTGGYGLSSATESDCSEWTVDQSTRTRTQKYKEHTSHQTQNSTSKGASFRRQSQRKHDQGYKYQICLYIQMQLCRPSTLADWIRNRNSADKSLSTQHTRYLAAATIFQQISCGIAHVHSREIVHRDLKPANIFHSADDDCFKIGDFGLSKVLRSANGGMPFGEDAPSSPLNNMETIVPWNHSNQITRNLQDPLTAGVGTSSYAAPEQLASHKYGREADIFR